MVAIEATYAIAPQKLGGLYVGGNHAFLDEPMCIVARQAANALNLARVVKLKAQLGQIELYRAAATTCFGERFI